MIRNTTTGASYATLAGAAAGDGWKRGDSVTLSPGEYETGGYVFNLGADDAGNPFTLSGYGAVLRDDAASPAEAVLSIRAAGVEVRGVGLRNTNPSGGRAIFVAPYGSDLVGLLIQDVTVLQQPVVNGYSPVYVHQDAAAGLIVSGEFRNLTFDIGQGYRDVVGLDGALECGRRGKLTFIDCHVFGATSTHPSGGSSNNCLSHDSSMEVYVIGGEWGFSGGTVIDQVYLENSRLIVIGAEVHNSQWCWNGSQLVSIGSTQTAGICAEYIESCHVHHCVTGIHLESTQRGDAVPIIRNCTVERDPTREIAEDGTARSDAAGIVIKYAGGMIENCVVSGWKHASIRGTSRVDSCILISPACREPGFGVTVRDSWFDGVYIGLDSSLGTGFVDLENCLWTGAPPHNVRRPVVWSVAGESAQRPVTVRARNNIVVWEPQRSTHPDTGIADAWYMLVADPAKVAFDASGGSNYFWSNGNTATLDGPAGTCRWALCGADTFCSNTAELKPCVDVSGRLAPDDPAAGCGAWWVPSLRPSRLIDTQATGSIVGGLSVQCTAGDALVARIWKSGSSLWLDRDGIVQEFTLSVAPADTLGGLVADIDAREAWDADLCDSVMATLPSGLLHDQPPRDALAAPCTLSWGRENQFAVTTDLSGTDLSPLSLLIDSGPFTGQYRPLLSYDPQTHVVLTQPFVSYWAARIWFNWGGMGQSTEGARWGATVQVTAADVRLTEYGGSGSQPPPISFAQYPALSNLMPAIASYADWNAELEPAVDAWTPSNKLVLRPAGHLYGWTCARPLHADGKPGAGAAVSIVTSTYPRAGALYERLTYSEADCNTNNTLDAHELALGVSPDEDGNGRPDECDAYCPTVAGDLTGDGCADADDVQPFVDLVLAAPGPALGAAACGDIDNNGTVNAADVPGFVEIMTRHTADDDGTTLRLQDRRHQCGLYPSLGEPSPAI